MTIRKRVVERSLEASHALSSPLPARVIAHSGVLRALTARLVGMGVRPELPRPE